MRFILFLFCFFLSLVGALFLKKHMFAVASDDFKYIPTGRVIVWSDEWYYFWRYEYDVECDILYCFYVSLSLSP